MDKYIIDDWIGKEDISNLSKKVITEKFNYFCGIKSQRVKELKKIIEPDLYQNQSLVFRNKENLNPLTEPLDKPIKMTLDFSLDSLLAISDWMTLKIAEYRNTVIIPDVVEQDMYLHVPEIWKSIASDISIYYFKVLEHNFNNNLSWCIQNELVGGYHYPAITGWDQLADYKDGIAFYILREIFVLIMDGGKEDFLIKRLNFHIEDLL